ncbi:MAG: hypothetical protein Q7T18_08150 [Sedimentisphaerales bacterium]|nr:hypothetical protein [Sedimentisphaerales bacterium]
MGAHNIPAKLNDPNAVFPTSGKAMWIDGIGWMLAWGTTIPTNGTAG